MFNVMRQHHAIVSRVAGDPRSFGTVYLGTNSGRGIIYGTFTKGAWRWIRPGPAPFMDH